MKTILILTLLLVGCATSYDASDKIEQRTKWLNQCGGSYLICEGGGRGRYACFDSRTGGTQHICECYCVR